MTGYQIALFVHLLALLAATAASAIVHFAASRRVSASTLRQALEWARVMGSAAKVFPLAVVTLLASGSYMVAMGGLWSWRAGWVIAGVVAAVTLLASGAVLGVRGAAGGRAAGARLQVAAGRELPNDAPPDRVSTIIAEANTYLALGVVAVMTLKPGLVGALSTIAIGWAIGAWIGVSHLRAHARGASQLAKVA